MACFNNKNLNEAITNYIINYNDGKYAKTDKQFEAHKIYGTEEKNGLTNAYAYSLFEGYSFVNGKFKVQSGGSYPVLLVLKKDNNKYSVVQYKEPMDGDD